MQAINEELAVTDHRAKLIDRIKRRTARVGVVGVGYIGLPLAVEQAKAGFTVIAFDQNPIRVAQLNLGSNYLRDVDDSDLASAVAKGSLSASTDFSGMADCDVLVMCVPTPVTRHKDPDTSFICGIASQISRSLRPGRLITLESTTYPGVTEDVLLPIFSSTGLKVGEDFFLAFSPERVDPGNARYRTVNTNKVVGGVTKACLDVASTFYLQTIGSVIPVSSPQVAEMSKVLENTFRAVNIALVNELAQLCDRMGINVWEVIDAAATKPFGMMRFNPGPGVGGHCIPLDPFYFSWKARQYDLHMRFTEAAAEINLSMPHFVRKRVARILNDRGLAIKDAKILIIGLSYKKDIDDWQESPALKALHLLEESGADVAYHDPHVPSMREVDGRLRHSVPLIDERLRRVDCVVIATDHSDIDWERVVKHSNAVLDTRNATKSVTGNRQNVVLL
ncbi:MAG: nucleotide sugar dehydrogenase [Candidatus Eremiobacteraeota bacterium]|nr:nucleotide sugar dehydrogenase [Candidatus Eremiobacteraeota bacterium]